MGQKKKRYRNTRDRKAAALRLGLAGAVALLLIGLLLIALWLDRRPEPQLTAPQTEITENRAPALRENLETVLIMGLDKFEAKEDPIGYVNDQQCDFLLLLVLDQDAGTCDLLHLNRDTMTPIRRLGVGGKDAGSFVGQLALAHTYGSGGSDSCLNTTQAVSRFLKGAPVDHYLSMTMEAVGILNDLVGGVTVTIPEDMTSVDPAFVSGTEVTLQGEQALKFVRARGSLEDSSNLARMERQRQYLDAFYGKLMEKQKSEDGFLHRALLKVNSQLRSDCSVSRLDQLGEKLEALEIQPIVAVPGEAVKGETYMEFHADDAGLNALLTQLFSDQKK